jgi:hypothetical protein
MQNIDCIVAHPVKNPEWITHDGDDAYLGALREARSSFGRTATFSNLRPIASAIAGLALAE